MKTKTVLIFLTAIAAVTGGYWYMFRTIPDDRENVENTASIVGTVSVEIGDTAFLPETITIKKNTEVVFTNTANEARWPASNIHPTHGIYPEFDPQRPIAPGESWSFVFTKVGTWKMHDHLVPRILGSITVTE